jgi:hypothetical protein
MGLLLKYKKWGSFYDFYSSLSPPSTSQKNILENMLIESIKEQEIIYGSNL